MPAPNPDALRQQQFLEAQKRHSQGDVLGALRIYEKIAAQAPTAAVFTYWALALLQLGRETEALGRAQTARERMPETGAIPERTVLSTVFRRLGRLDVAESLLREALAQEPGNAAARNNLALVLMQKGQWDEADALFAEAQKELPEDAAPALNRMRIALNRRDFEQAEAMLRAAKDAQPGHPDVALMEARLALMEADAPRAAEAVFKTLAKAPAHPEAWNVLAALEPAHMPHERLEKLLAELVRLKPTSAKLLGMAVGLARKHLAWKSLAALEALLNDALEGNQDAVIETGAMFLLLSANISQKAHRMAAHNGFEAYVARGRNAERPAPQPLAGRKLRVGYLSSDLRGHAIGYLVAGVMEAHKASETCEFIAYSNWPNDTSDIRQRMRAAFSRFINIAELSDADLAARMREDGIDVLVDLNQMTAANRVGVFCHGPAPVTIQWLGMPGTLGAGARVDYVLLDPWTGYPGNLDGFDEQPVLLAGSYQPNDWQKPDLSKGKTRADWNLPETAPVFCSFNQTQKFSPDTMALWAEILRQAPDAVLWVLAGDPVLEERFTRIFTEAGIAKERIVFAPRAAHDVHIARLAHADLMLDNWPYNAHTTCSDALRAGTPVLTLPGATFASRVAAGILETAGLAEWIAASPEAYVAKAVAYAQQPWEARQALKREIAERYWTSPMVDCAAFARRLEAFYRAAFERALAGEAPAPAWVGWHGDVHWELPPAEAWRQTVLANRPDGRAVADFVANVGAPERVSPPDVTQATPSAVPSAPVAAPQAPVAAAPASSPLRRGGPEARLANLRHLRDDLLGLEAPLVLDVGAKPEDPKPWDALARAGLVRLVGFDPQSPETAEGAVRILPYALGDGAEHTLHLAQADGMTSLLEPDFAWLGRFPRFAQWAAPRGIERLSTHRLDDLPELESARFLKIDTQGSEAMILKHATKRLDESLVLLELELSPVPLYRGEPSFFAVGRWLEEQGWILHTFSNLNRRMFKPLGNDESPYEGLRHVFQVDAVFFPHPDRWAQFAPERLLALAYLAHALYRSFDVAALALHTLDARDGGTRLARYRRYLEEAGVDA